MDARQPIGPIKPLTPRDPGGLRAAAGRMQAAAQDWRDLLLGEDGRGGLDAAALARTYRPGAFTVRQLAHHVADAHLHGLARLKSGLSTPGFTVQPFDQEAWLTLPDAGLPPEAALALLDALNVRWAALLTETNPAEFDRRITHPTEGEQDLWHLTAKHDWHLRHHLAQARLALGDCVTGECGTGEHGERPA